MRTKRTETTSALSLSAAPVPKALATTNVMIDERSALEAKTQAAGRNGGLSPQK
jgi:hypothetical protein